MTPIPLDSLHTDTQRGCFGAIHPTWAQGQDCDSSEGHLKARGPIDGVAKALEKSARVRGCSKGWTNRDAGKDRLPSRLYVALSHRGSRREVRVAG